LALAWSPFFARRRRERPTAQTEHLHEGAIIFGTALVILGIVAHRAGRIRTLAYIAQTASRPRGLAAALVFEHYRSNAIGRDRFGVAVASARTVSGEVEQR
jgi:hypothetical protein